MKQGALRSAVLVTAWALSGCGSATGTNPSGDSSGTLVVWDWKSSDKTAASYVSKAGKGPDVMHVALSSKTQDLMGRLSRELLSGTVTVEDALKQLAASDKAN